MNKNNFKIMIIMFLLPALSKAEQFIKIYDVFYGPILTIGAYAIDPFNQKLRNELKGFYLKNATAKFKELCEGKNQCIVKISDEDLPTLSKEIEENKALNPTVFNDSSIYRDIKFHVFYYCFDKEDKEYILPGFFLEAVRFLNEGAVLDCPK